MTREETQELISLRRLFERGYVAATIDQTRDELRAVPIADLVVLLYRMTYRAELLAQKLAGASEHIAIKNTVARAASYFETLAMDAYPPAQSPSVFVNYDTVAETLVGLIMGLLCTSADLIIVYRRCRRVERADERRRNAIKDQVRLGMTRLQRDGSYLIKYVRSE